MAPVAVPTLESLSLEDAPPAKQVVDVEEEEGDDDDDEVEEGGEPVGDAKKKKKKKKCMYISVQVQPYIQSSVHS